MRKIFIFCSFIIRPCISVIFFLLSNFIIFQSQQIKQNRTMEKRLSVFTHFRIAVLLLLYLLSLSQAQNLICRGDFQGWDPQSSYFGELYRFVPSNYSCWYNKIDSYFQIKRKNVVNSCTAQLVTFSNYPLCQNVFLVNQSQYMLNFTVINSQEMKYSKVKVFINDKVIYNYQTKNSNNVSKASVQFIATQAKNQLCFESDFYIASLLYSICMGPCLDDISLFKIGPNKTPANQTSVANETTQNSVANGTTQNSVTGETNQNSGTQVTSQTQNSSENTDMIIPENVPYDGPSIFQIYCRTIQVSEIQWHITFQCALPERIDRFLSLLTSSLEIRVGQSGTIYFGEITDFSLSSITLRTPLIGNNLIINIENINIKMKQDQLKIYNPPPKFIFYIDGKPFTLIQFNEIDKKTLKYFSSVSKQVLSKSQLFYQTLKGSFFSYFLMNIINFWNLSLMYNLLKISNVPMFSKFLLQDLTDIFFNLNSILEWLSEKIPSLKEKLIVHGFQIRELIEDKKYDLDWFGSYGVSSKYFKNNLENLVMIATLCLKIVVILFLKKCLPRWLRKKMISSINLFRLFLLELISLQTFIVLSAAGNLIKSGVSSFMGKLNFIIQVMALMGSIFIFCLYFTTSTKIKTSKIMQKIKMVKNKKLYIQNYKHLKKKAFKKALVTQIHNILELIPILVIPFLIIFDHPLFFLISTSFLVLLRIFWFFKNFSLLMLQWDEKLFTIINNLFWLLLQLSYLLLYFIPEIRSAVNLQKETVYLVIKICGYATLVAVAFGGLFQIVRFGVQILKSIIIGLKKIWKKYIKPKKIRANSKSTKQIGQKSKKTQKIAKKEKGEKKQKLMQCISLKNPKIGFTRNFIRDQEGNKNRAYHDSGQNTPKQEKIKVEKVNFSDFNSVINSKKW